MVTNRLGNGGLTFDRDCRLHVSRLYYFLEKVMTPFGVQVDGSPCE